MIKSEQPQSDDSEFDEFFTKHRAMLLNYMRKHWPNIPVHSHEDIVQTGLANFWLGRDQIAGFADGTVDGDTLDAILVQTVKRAAHNEFRTQNTQRRGRGITHLHLDDLEYGPDAIAGCQVRHPSDGCLVEDTRNGLVSDFWKLDRNPRQSRRELVLLLRMILTIPDPVPLAELVASLTAEERRFFLLSPIEATVTPVEQRDIIYPRVKSSRSSIRAKLKK